MDSSCDWSKGPLGASILSGPILGSAILAVYWWVSKSVQVLSYGIEAIVVLTVILLK